MGRNIAWAKRSLSIVDHRETYDRHELDGFMDNIKASTCADVGVRSGQDLAAHSGGVPGTP